MTKLLRKPRHILRKRKEKKRKKVSKKKKKKGKKRGKSHLRDFTGTVIASSPNRSQGVEREKKVQRGKKKKEKKKKEKGGGKDAEPSFPLLPAGNERL